MRRSTHQAAITAADEQLAETARLSSCSIGRITAEAVGPAAMKKAPERRALRRLRPTLKCPRWSGRGRLRYHRAGEAVAQLFLLDSQQGGGALVVAVHEGEGLQHQRALGLLDGGAHRHADLAVVALDQLVGTQVAQGDLV